MVVRRLVIGPGAMAYFLFIGALSALKDTSALNELEAISGSSAGGLLGLLYILAKGDVRRVFEYSLKVPIKTIMKPNIRTFLRSYGLVSTLKVRKIFQETLFEFLKKNDVTFRELYDYYPVKLYISSCCINLSVTHYFSVDATPDMSVLDALCMTIAVPFLFETVEHAPWRYIDGGTLEETPCTPFIGLSDVHVICMDTDQTTMDIPDLKTYIFHILGAAMNLRHRYAQFPKTSLRMDALNMFDFGASTDSKIKMFMSGYQNFLTQSKCI